MDKAVYNYLAAQCQLWNVNWCTIYGRQQYSNREWTQFKLLTYTKPMTILRHAQRTKDAFNAVKAVPGERHASRTNFQPIIISDKLWQTAQKFRYLCSTFQYFTVHCFSWSLSEPISVLPTRFSLPFFFQAQIFSVTAFFLLFPFFCLSFKLN